MWYKLCTGISFLYSPAKSSYEHNLEQTIFVGVVVVAFMSHTHLTKHYFLNVKKKKKTLKA